MAEPKVDGGAPVVDNGRQKTRISTEMAAESSIEVADQQVNNNLAGGLGSDINADSGSQQAPEVVPVLSRPSVEERPFQVDNSVPMLESSDGKSVIGGDDRQSQNTTTGASDTRYTQGALDGHKQHGHSPTMNIDGATRVQDEDNQQDQNTSTKVSSTEITRGASNGHEQNSNSQVVVTDCVTPSQDGSPQQTQFAPVPVPAPAPVPSLAQMPAAVAAQNASIGLQQHDDSLMARSRLFNGSMTDPMEWIESSMMDDDTIGDYMTDSNPIIDDAVLEIARPQVTGSLLGQRSQEPALAADYPQLINPYVNIMAQRLFETNTPVPGKPIKTMITRYWVHRIDVI